MRQTIKSAWMVWALIELICSWPKKSNLEVVLPEKMGMSRFSLVPLLPVFPYTDRRGSAEACLVLHLIFVMPGKWPWLFHSRLNQGHTPNFSMQSHLSYEMGVAAYRLPARRQDYPRCTYAAGPSVAGLQAKLQALAPRFQDGYVRIRHHQNPF